MRKFLIWIVPLMLMTAAVAGELEIGSDIPMADVKMVDVSGKKVSLNDAVGENGLLVVFSCNTCPWVDAWEDRYISVSKLSQKKGVGMIAINPNQGSRKKGDGMEDMQTRAKKQSTISTTPWTRGRNWLPLLVPPRHLTFIFSTIKVHWSTAAP
jgi:hypothetical protein